VESTPACVDFEDVIDARKREAEGLLGERLIERICWTPLGSRIRLSRRDCVTLPPGEELWGLTYRARDGYGGVGIEEQMFVFGPVSVRALRVRRKWRSIPSRAHRATAGSLPGPG
jgi:hypothetical protein